MTVARDSYNNPFWIFFIVGMMTLLGFYLRLYNLDWQCLKVDEMVTQVAALHSTSWIMQWALTTDYNPPLYYLAAHWSSVFFGGATAFAIRLPAAICSAMLIPLSYLLGKAMKDTSLGYLMAGVATFLFPYFFYAQDARAYPMVLMFFVVFLYFYAQMWYGGMNAINVFGIGGSIGCCLWTHYYVALPIAILLCFLIYRFRAFRYDLQGIGLSMVFAFIVLLPMISVFDISQFFTRTNHGLFNVLWNTPYLIAMTVTNEMLCWSWIVLIPLAIYSIYKYHREESIFLPLTFAIIISTLFLIPMAHFTAVMPRYALVSTPMLLLIALYPVSEWIEKQSTIEKKFAGIVLFLMLIFVFNFGSIYQWLTFSICPMMNGGV